MIPRIIRFSAENRFLVLAASLLLLAVTLAGCAQSAVPSNPSSAPSASSNNPGGSSAVVSSPTVVSPASGNLVAENKTGFDKNQTTIASILPDGNYEKQVTYAYHSGNSTVDFKLIVQNDVITSASAGHSTPSARLAQNKRAIRPAAAVCALVELTPYPEPARERAVLVLPHASLPLRGEPPPELEGVGGLPRESLVVSHDGASPQVLPDGEEKLLPLRRRRQGDHLERRRRPESARER